MLPTKILHPKKVSSQEGVKKSYGALVVSSSGVTVNLSWTVAWATGGDTYAVNDLVMHGGSNYVCIQAHTSTGTGATDEPGVGATWTSYWALGPTADNTVIQWGTDNVTFGNEQEETAAATTATVSGLTPSTTYYFRIVRRNAAGDSDASNTLTVNT